ncbi:MAG: citrate/2-methylcitrate synthase [Clostridia bacterium]|nr:citrate/2-methylcitrate synthase [Clostridia bacterium]
MEFEMNSPILSEYIHELCEGFELNTKLQAAMHESGSIKRGLRNDDGTGVMVGYTTVGSVRGYTMLDGERVPMEGQLIYRGYNLNDLIRGFTRDHRFGFAEIAYLLLFGELPNPEQYQKFRTALDSFTTLPPNFTEDMILKHPSKDIMNKLARSVLSLYSSDPNPDDLSLENLMRQSMELIARFPTIIAHAYSVKRHYFDNDSLYLHRPIPGLSLAENFLRSIRPDGKYSMEEALLLDLCMVCHAEHGGGNNSTFTCRSVSSTGTDTYSAIGAAVGSLRGPKHGGANAQVLRQFEQVKANVNDWQDDEEVEAFVKRILNKEVCDHTGLVYGMGHAVYTLSDPRTVILKKRAKKLAEQKGMLAELQLMETIERVTPKAFADVTGNSKVMCANVDMYSGLIYRMLGIPEELYTPLFAMARITGWCAHRMEEVLYGGRIYRPAYKSMMPYKTYVKLKERD